MYINDTKIIGNTIAFDDCHKIYICENSEDCKNAVEFGYDLYNIEQLQEIWNKASECGLQFVYNWNLNKVYVEQFEQLRIYY